MTLRLKIVIALVGLLVFIAGASVLYVKFHFAAQLHVELEKRGISIARNLAQHSTTSMLARDRLALKMLAVAQARSEADIVYIFFLGPRGQMVLAHTFGDSFPLELIAANPLPAAKVYSVRNLSSESGAIYDIAMPIEGGGLGQVRVGISAKPVSNAVATLSGQLLLMIVLLGTAALLLSLPLIAKIVRPVEALTAAAEGVATGDFDRQVPVVSHDEIGQLATTFNHMIVRLQKARHELLARNTELAEEVDRRRGAETELAAQLQLLSILLDEIPTPVFFKDVTGVYRGCNRAFEAFTGVSRNELTGHTVADFLPANEATVHSHADQELFAHPGSCRYELFFNDRQGQRRDVVLQKATYNLPTGELAGMVGILIDVTNEREVDRLRSDFVSTAAHEFQTPLTAILGFGELLLADDELPLEVRRSYLGIIQERGEYLSRLVDRFLDVSRIEAGRALPVDPRRCYPDQLLRRVLHSYTKQKSKYRFELHLPPHPPAILADETRIIQVVENLLSNAVKYAPSGSCIRIDGACSDDRFILTVADEGPGLTTEQRTKIFDKFYRADSSDHAPSGTGLGLYISRAIVAAHGGQLEVTSLPGAGSCFRIDLPLAPAEEISTT